MSWSGIHRTMSDDSPNERYDVIIVGSGPAGMSAAMHLAGRGFRTLVIERLSGNYARYHSTCGEAVSDAMFRRIGWMPGSVIGEVDTLRITFSETATVDVPIEGYIVDRLSMLGEMRERSDATFVNGAVTSVERIGDGYRVVMSDGRPYTCDWLIGADGAHSVVRRDIMHRGMTASLPIVNCIAEGEADPVLTFHVGGRYTGGYSWNFPSKPGTVSIGFPKGDGDPGSIPGLVFKGGRDLPFGAIRESVDGRCMLVGDAACLANPLCYGGIGIAMYSGRLAAEAVIAGDTRDYERWLRRSPLLDDHFMEAHDRFSQWTDEDIGDAMVPFRKGYSLLRGIYACIRRPRLANVYFATFVAFRLGW